MKVKKVSPTKFSVEFSTQHKATFEFSEQGMNCIQTITAETGRTIRHRTTTNWHDLLAASEKQLTMNLV